MSPNLKDLRTGIAYDVHRLAPGRQFILGGVVFDHPVGPVGHSDADVLLHVIIDALLSAANMGDIGKLFPDTSAEWASVSSLRMLDMVSQKLEKNGITIINIDSVVICDRPKIGSRVDEMKSLIASSLNVLPDQIGIKGKTSEKLGFVGAEEGIEAYATCLIIKAKQ